MAKKAILMDIGKTHLTKRFLADVTAAGNQLQLQLQLHPGSSTKCGRTKPAPRSPRPGAAALPPRDGLPSAPAPGLPLPCLRPAHPLFSSLRPAAALLSRSCAR